MNELLARISSRFKSPSDSRLHERVDALVCGDCSEDDFVREFMDLRDSAPGSTSDIVALIDQRYRRGQMPAELFHSIESKITHRRSQDRHATEDLHPEPMPQVDTTADLAPPMACGAMQAASGAVGEDTATQGMATAEPEHVELPAPPVEGGRVLRGRYVLGERLGSGGMGTVYKALDRYRADLPEGSRYVAVKVLHEKISKRPNVFANLRREFYHAQALTHENIVNVFEMDRDDEVAFFTMELLEGSLLSEVMERTRPQPIDRSYAWAVIRSVGAGLAHAHSRNVVHGDLKPQNVMITHGGEVRILDFGAAGVASLALSNTAPLDRKYPPAVTAAYACCELLDGQQTDPRDDLYALACLSYELLAGDHPFQRRRSTEARDRGILPRRPPGLTGRQWRTLVMGLSWYREHRSISVREWLIRLGLEPAATGRLTPPRDVKPMRAVIPTRAARRTTASWRTVALLVGLFSSAGLWAALHHTSLHLRAARGEGPAAGPTPMSQSPLPSPAHPQSMPAEVRPQRAPPVTHHASVTHKQPPESAPIRGGARRPLGASGESGTISLTAATHRVRWNDNFAELRVVRSDGPDGDASFVWWTSADSAKPGEDFIAQGRTTQFFPKGRRATSLFVRIMPNASRKSAQVFYVVIGESRGASLGPVARTAIWIPPDRDTLTPR
jgi:serine/threonine protein kinase